MRKFITALLMVLFTCVTTPGASAHVEIISSFPEQFTNVNPIPTQLWIEFSGDLQTLEGEAVNSIEVTDSTGLLVNYEEPIIMGGKISTKISGQSAPGVFEVKYRVVGDDGHVIEGDYSFNASPDYSVEQSPMPISQLEEEPRLPVGGILLGALFCVFLVSLFMKSKNRSK